MQMHKDLPVQSLFKGCRLTSDGTIKYFNATDWDHYEDGSEVTNGIEDGNDAGSGSTAGLFFSLHSYRGLGAARASVGTRLVYIP